MKIGIKICNETYQNLGLGCIVLSMLISELFDRIGYSRIILDTNKSNKRAQHVYEALGFQKERVRPNAFRDDTGVWQTAVDYSLGKCDFVNYAIKRKQAVEWRAIPRLFLPVMHVPLSPEDCLQPHPHAGRYQALRRP